MIEQSRAKKDEDRECVHSQEQSSVWRSVVWLPLLLDFVFMKVQTRPMAKWQSSSCLDIDTSVYFLTFPYLMPLDMEWKQNMGLRHD